MHWTHEELATEWLRDQPPATALRELQRAMKRITEDLAFDLGGAGCAGRGWSEMDWSLARAVTAIHGVSGVVGGPRAPARADWDAFLAQQRQGIALRWQRMQRLLADIGDSAARHGVGLVALKGAALHAAAVYVPGERPMADLDLLVPAAELQRAVSLLAGLGFQITGRTWKHLMLESVDHSSPAALGEGAANRLKIDLHESIQERLGGLRVDITRALMPRGLQPGINGYPSRVELLRHLLLHAAGAMCFRAVRLIQLHDIACLARAMSPDEWAALLGRQPPLQRDARSLRPRDAWWMHPVLCLTQRYYRCVPDWVLRHTAAACPWLLARISRRRVLTDVSLSYLWITAFPGIEWCRTPRSVAACVLERVFPSAETCALRSELASREPLNSGGSWGQLSQGRRVLRWVRSRPARHASLQPVRAALQSWG